MLKNQTISKLIQMRLPAMADALALQLQSADYAELSFEDRLVNTSVRFEPLS